MNKWIFAAAVCLGLAAPALAETPARPANLPEGHVPAESGRSKMEAAIAGETERLRGQYRERLAGLYVEHDAGRIVVRLTGTDPVEEEAHEIDGETLRVVYEVGAPHSFMELMTRLNEGSGTIDATLPSAHARYVDERTGEVVIAVHPEPDDISAAQDELAAALDAPVRIEVQEPVTHQPAPQPIRN